MAFIMINESGEYAVQSHARTHRGLQARYHYTTNINQATMFHGEPRMIKVKGLMNCTPLRAKETRTVKLVNT